MQSTAPSDARRLHEEVRSSAAPVEVSTRRLSALQSPEVAHHISPAIPTLVPSLDRKDAHSNSTISFHSLGTQRLGRMFQTMSGFKLARTQTSHYARSCIGASYQFLSNEMSAFDWHGIGRRSWRRGGIFPCIIGDERCVCRRLELTWTEERVARDVCRYRSS